MTDKRRDKIQRLLALANDANDEESMSALTKAQKMMIEYQISEDELFQYRQQQFTQEITTSVIYKGRPQKWMYRLARIIAPNFRAKFYYESKTPIELCFVGLSVDVQIAEITFLYASGSISYCARKYMQQPTIKRKRKRKWELKQDYIQGYLQGLSKVLNQQVLTNGYEIALQLPEIVTIYIQELGLVKGKDTSHQVKNYDAFHFGYQEGLSFKQHNQIEC